MWKKANLKIWLAILVLLLVLAIPTVASAQSKMYWIDYVNGKIWRANLDGTTVEDVVTGLSGPIGIALDVAAGKMYWTDYLTYKIQRANLDGTSVEDVVIGLLGPNGIALDVAAGKMYWTASWTDKIQRANLDGTSVEDVVTGLSVPIGIALDVAAGKMYWTDPGTDKIQRANLNGSEVEDLVTTGLTYPSWIALDVAAGKMYWTDSGTYNKIQRANLDGSSVQDLVTSLSHPEGIALAIERIPIYVDANQPGGDGSSWAEAYKYLQDALAVAGSGNDIWVAQGTYKPDANSSDPCSGDRNATFQLINGVGIYGGFDGTETSRDQRDWQNNETILSGEIGTIDDNTDNSYHVVTGSGTEPNAVLDGFTITAGNANGTCEECTCGAGMFNKAGDPTLTNCTFSGNSALSGGGMYNDDSSPTVTNCAFNGNWALDGGGMRNDGSSPTVTNCTFSGNSAKRCGGGMDNGRSSPMVTNCAFNRNSADDRGGAMDNDGSSPTVTNCTFSSNSASNGNAIACDSYNQSDPSVVNITNCILWDGGDEIWNNDGSTVTISYSDIAGGWSDTGGNNIDANPLLVDPNGLDGIPGTADDEEGYVHLRGYSPCINAGDPASDYSGQVDIDNQPRVAYGRVDMGADEVYPILGDSEPDGDVDFKDFARFANHWLLGL